MPYLAFSRGPFQNASPRRHPSKMAPTNHTGMAASTKTSTPPKKLHLSTPSWEPRQGLTPLQSSSYGGGGKGEMDPDPWLSVCPLQSHLNLTASHTRSYPFHQCTYSSHKLRHNRRTQAAHTGYSPEVLGSSDQGGLCFYTRCPQHKVSPSTPGHTVDQPNTQKQTERVKQTEETEEYVPSKKTKQNLRKLTKQNRYN